MVTPISVYKFVVMINIEFELKLRNYMPLCFVDEVSIIVSKRNKIFIYNLEKKTNFFLVYLPQSVFTNVLSSFNLTNRLLRLGVRKAIKISTEIVLVVFNNSFYEININKRSFVKVFDIVRGNRPLNITEVKAISNFDDGFYFGEYFENFENKPVNVYKRFEDSTWGIVFTFPENTIEHVHNIIADPLNDCLWILTGDFGNAAAIFMAKNNFEEVVPILLGKQEYRSCVAFPTDRGLLYATDSQFEQNSIRLLRKNGEKWISEFISNVNGPVIYGCKVNSDFFFSTSVEGDGLSKGRIMKYLDTKRGLGVVEDYSHIIGGNLDEGFNVLDKFKKDRFPFILFQFGNILFPEGDNMSNKLITFCIGLVSRDLTLTIYKINKKDDK
jgi:hypothetical protein